MDKSYHSLAAMMGAYKNAMRMKRENIANRGVWKAKKMYILNVYDSEGERYTEPKMKMMGVEAVRSTTPEHAKKAIIDSFRIILNEDEKTLQNYVSEFRSTFNSLPLDEIGRISGVAGIEKYDRGNGAVADHCPIHVKAAITYNHMLTKKKLTNKYERIRSGDKLRYLNLVEPNPYNNSPVMAIVKPMPQEFGDVGKYVDYDEQFKKTYLNAVTSITDVIDWKPEKTATLEDFFV